MTIMNPFDIKFIYKNNCEKLRRKFEDLDFQDGLLSEVMTKCQPPAGHNGKHVLDVPTYSENIPPSRPLPELPSVHQIS